MGQNHRHADAHHEANESHRSVHGHAGSERRKPLHRREAHHEQPNAARDDTNPQRAKPERTRCEIVVNHRRPPAVVEEIHDRLPARGERVAVDADVDVGPLVDVLHDVPQAAEDALGHAGETREPAVVLFAGAALGHVRHGPERLQHGHNERAEADGAEARGERAVERADRGLARVGLVPPGGDDARRGAREHVLHDLLPPVDAHEHVEEREVRREADAEAAVAAAAAGEVDLAVAVRVGLDEELVHAERGQRPERHPRELLQHEREGQGEDAGVGLQRGARGPEVGGREADAALHGEDVPDVDGGQDEQHERRPRVHAQGGGREAQHQRDVEPQRHADHGRGVRQQQPQPGQ
ncbi:unnamed protein product [Phytophthora fragariaefolia]|uniref:Unnamed protein product n=1 Tax=Phytophthora fragariaefolia TaxID=1490495 RepID=A0A9W7CVB4_9STRA|nr:unnamed protein product [Phytophthora fragariaefolia]